MRCASTSATPSVPLKIFLTSQVQQPAIFLTTKETAAVGKLLWILFHVLLAASISRLAGNDDQRSTIRTRWPRRDQTRGPGMRTSTPRLQRGNFKSTKDQNTVSSILIQVRILHIFCSFANQTRIGKPTS
mmetsp:Transcript_352/g.871  ORF Transcript_352/g.871 Transcript_352/m.871 type:complete len:130 (+) Transcript_352:118-507(+)